MTYFNFTKVSPPAPNDPNVRVVNHLNNNWDEIEFRLGLMITGRTSMLNPVQGQEFVAGSAPIRFRVIYDAINNFGRDPENSDTFWSSWTTLPLSSNVVARTGYVPQYRINSTLRLVELTGSVMKDAIGSAWPASSVILTTGTSGIPNTQGPIGGLSIQTTAAALPSSANGAGGYNRIDINGSFVQVQSRYVGGPGGGNFIMLNGIKWWY